MYSTPGAPFMCWHLRDQAVQIKIFYTFSHEYKILEMTQTPDRLLSDHYIVPCNKIHKKRYRLMGKGSTVFVENMMGRHELES